MEMNEHISDFFSEINLCDSGPCLNGGVCNSAPGTYSCDCAVDFTGNNCETGEEMLFF